MWQPIETAPKTGDEILLAWRWGYDEQPWQIAVGYWHDELEDFQLSVMHETIEQPISHWMPLPKPPA
jgi:hypothetical protein